MASTHGIYKLINAISKCASPQVLYIEHGTVIRHISADSSPGRTMLAKNDKRVIGVYNARIKAGHMREDIHAAVAARNVPENVPRKKQKSAKTKR